MVFRLLKFVPPMLYKMSSIRTGLLLVILSLGFGLNAQFVEEKSIKNTDSESEDQVMQIEVFNGKTRQGMKADVMIKGPNPRKTVVLEAIDDTTLTLKKYRLYTVSVIKPGFMYFAHKFWPDEMAIHTEPVELKPIAVGLKTSIEDITFMGDETEIYHKSVPALDEVKTWLELNPSASICVIGHVNGPDNEKSPSFYKKASERRADAVRAWLIQHGIAKERLTIRGAGNTEMVYADPKTDWENQANRRIEIEVTAY
jgi:outer membrane protein OmpA-like peptidoglycan-associated protein